MNQEKLLELKKEIDKAKIQIAELRGQEKQLMNELKTKWNCTSLEEAEKKIEKWNEEISQLESKITKGVQKLSETYGFY